MTCRKRRVKCDEAKPGCQRCLKAGRQCDGYQPVRTWLFEPRGKRDVSRSGSVLSPLDQAGSQSASRYAVKTDGAIASPGNVVPLHHNSRREGAQPSVLSQPSGAYQTMDEQRAFKWYMERLVVIPIRYSDPWIWEVLVPQIAFSHRGPRHILMALALLHESSAPAIRITGLASRGPIVRHLNVAYNCLAMSNPSMCVMLLSGLLLQFLESLAQNITVAQRHLTNCAKILEEYEQQLQHGNELNQDEAEIVLGKIRPTVDIAIEFATAAAESARKQPSRFIAHGVDQYNLRHKMTRGGVVDAFYSKQDTRNNIGSWAVRVGETRRKVWKTYSDARKQEFNSAIGDLIEVGRHFKRLARPVLQADDLEDRLIWVHYQTITLMIDDTIAETDAVDIIFDEPTKFDLEAVAAEILALVSTTAVRSNQDFQIELGIIPPLFYLTTASHRAVSLPTRQNTLKCLINVLGDRREGAWSGSLAADIAQQYMNYEAEISSPSSSTSQRSVRVEKSRETSKLETLGVQDSQAVSTQNPMRHLEANRQDILKKCMKVLPEQLSHLILSAGYQGYFSKSLQHIEIAPPGS